MPDCIKCHQPIRLDPLTGTACGCSDAAGITDQPLPTPADIERVARAMCRQSHINPDAPAYLGPPLQVQHGYIPVGEPRPAWRLFYMLASAALQATP